MFHEIAPHRFDNAFANRRAPDGEDYLLCFHQGQLLLQQQPQGLVLPRVGLLPAQQWDALRFLFVMDGRGCYWLQQAPDCPPRGDLCYYPTAKLREMPDTLVRFAGLEGQQITRWYETNRHCGRCGARMEHTAEERALRCPQCGNLVYPRITPAVITVVTDGEKILLAKGLHSQRFALIAGFVEFGESLEQAVAREVWEEVGIRVKNIRYYASQPWPFPDSIMLGFFAELDGDPTLTLQETEIAQAGWFTRDQVDRRDTTMSIAGEMINAYLDGRMPR